MWWNTVFEAAGFKNAFRVEDMPADMDPMDARYNVIQWVHRTDPDYSIGPEYADPRTGEIIKAAVRMESHRSVVDYDCSPAPRRPAPAPRRRIRSRRTKGLGDWIASLDPTSARWTSPWRAAASMPPTKWGTRSGSPTTSSPPPMDGPR